MRAPRRDGPTDLERTERLQGGDPCEFGLYIEHVRAPGTDPWS